MGDVYANGAVVGRDFTKDPGLHRTMLGDGLATMAAGVLGGPPNTTYSENTAVLAATGNYNPVTLRIAALIAIVDLLLRQGHRRNRNRSRPACSAARASCSTV